MNIQSISELTALTALYPNACKTFNARLNTDSNATTDFNEIAKAINSNYTINNILDNQNFNVLSCQDFFVEASYETTNNVYKSLKFNLGDALSRIAKTLALIAIKNLNALTKDKADEYYVPYSGNIGPNKKPVTGLWIQQTGSAGNTTALSVDGPVFVCNASKQKLLEINPNNSIGSSTITINGGTFNASSTSQSNFSKLTATAITASTNAEIRQLSADKLSANELSLGRKSETSWLVTLNDTKDTLTVAGTINATDGNFTTLTAANLTANVLSAGLKSENKYNLAVNDSNVNAGPLVAASLNCAGAIDCNSTISCKGNLSSTGQICCESNINGNGYISCTDNLCSQGTISCKTKFETAGFIFANTNISCNGSISCKNDLTCGKSISVYTNLSCNGVISGHSTLTCEGNLCCKGILSARELNAGIKDGKINLLVPDSGTIKIKELSTQKTECLTNLKVGSTGAYNLDVPATGTITINKLAATDLSAGIGTDFTVVKASSSENKLKLSKLEVTEANGLSASNGIAHLTAEAACWS